MMCQIYLEESQFRLKSHLFLSLVMSLRKMEVLTSILQVLVMSLSCLRFPFPTFR